MKRMNGTVTFVHGPMFGGKSARLQMTLDQIRRSAQPVVVLRFAPESQELESTPPPRKVLKVTRVHSRTGMDSQAYELTPDDDLAHVLPASASHVLIDEAQFMTRAHVHKLVEWVDSTKSDSICYGLRTDANGMLFPGSQALFELADHLESMASICKCGKPALFTGNTGARSDGENSVLIRIGDDGYVAQCRACWRLSKE